MRIDHVLVLMLFHLGSCIQIFEWQRDWGDGIFTRELAQVLPEVTQIIHSATENNVPSNAPVISLYNYASDSVEFPNGLMVIRPLLSEDHQICFIGQISGHWSSDYNTLQYRHGATITSNIPEAYDLDHAFPDNFDPLSLTPVTDFCGVNRSHMFYLRKTSNLLPNTTVLNIQGLFEGYAVTVTEELEHLIFVPPLSRYSKLLVTASCEYEKGQGHSTSHYCPGYSNAKVTPYEGIKTEKLSQMAEVFCSHCASEDFICKQLFCPPDILIVNLTQTVLGSFCESIETGFPACHSEFCTSPLSRRGVRRSDPSPPLSSKLNGQLTCQASLTWAAVAGMDAWCKSNCVNGYDGIICTEQYCDCSLPQTTTTASVIGNQPADVCTEWEANPTYAGTAGIDNWCQNMCSSGRCPLSHCQCKAVPTSTSTTSSTTTARPTTTSSPTTSARPTTTSSPTTFTRPTTTSSIATTRQTTKSSTTTTATHRPTTKSSLSTTATSGTAPTTTRETITPKTMTKTTKTSTTTEITRTTRTQTSRTRTTQKPTMPTKTEETKIPTTTTETTMSSTEETKIPTTTTETTTSSSADTKIPETNTETTTSSTAETKIPTTTTETTTSSTTKTKIPITNTETTTITATTSTRITRTATSGKTPSPTTASESTTPTTRQTTLRMPMKTASMTTIERAKTTMSATARPTVSPTTLSIPTTPVSSTTLNGSATLSAPVSTSSVMATNVTDEDSLSIVDQIVCDHAKFQGQNKVTARFCHREGQGQTQNGAAGEKTGFSEDIINQVFGFAPQILCSLTSGSARTDSCTNMFCGESPLSQRVIRSAMCRVCQIFIAEGYTDCLNTYC